MASDPTDLRLHVLELEERLKRAEEGRQQAEERNRPTTLIELMRFGHTLLSLPLKVGELSKSTTGTIPALAGKFCPTRLEPWVDCPAQQQELYRAVCGYLQSEDAPRLFPPLIELEGHHRRLTSRSISSEQDIEHYERYAVEYPVSDIIKELCKIPAARDEFRLSDGVEFNSHINSLTNQVVGADTSQPSSTPNPRPDQFWIHRVNGDTKTILTTVEYKPPHKLSVETLRLGLRPMDLWKDMVHSNKIPTEDAKKVRYNAERLVCSAIVQEYHDDSEWTRIFLCDERNCTCPSPRSIRES